MVFLPVVASPRPLIPGTSIGLRTEEAGLGVGERITVVARGLRVGDGAAGRRVGTIARIAALRPGPDGACYLDAAGEDLVRLGRRGEDGRVEAVPVDAVGAPVPPGLVVDVERALRAHLAARVEWGESISLEVTLSGDPVTASHEVASHLRISWPEVQELLEAGTAGDRLQRALLVLRRETGLLRSTLGWKGTT